MDPKVAWVGQLTPFMALEDDDLQLVAGACSRRSHPAGETLIVKGVYGDEVFVIARGRVRVHRDGDDVAVLGRGGIVGELAMVHDPHRTADVVAVEDLDLAVFERSDFLALLERVPSFDRLVRQTADLRAAALKGPPTPT